MKLNIIYSPEKDAQNHVDTAYKFKFLKHGREDIESSLRSKLPSALQEIMSTSADENEAYDKTLKFLSAWSKKQPEIVDKSINSLKDYWDKTGSAIIKNLEFFYQKPFPFEEITVYLTMIPISPYSYAGRYMFIYAQMPPMGQVSSILHELNHFMFYYYYSELEEKLGKEKYELLKESLTFFTNPGQTGKPNETELRKLYSSKQWKNVDDIVDEASSLLFS